MTDTGTGRTGWARVLPGAAVPSERGIAVLVGTAQVAVFRTFDGRLHAIDHLDPCSGAHVLARGIVGTRGRADVVSSPMHKQAFDLRTGECLDTLGVRVRVWPVRERDGFVEIGPTPDRTGGGTGRPSDAGDRTARRDGAAARPAMAEAGP